jgi:hypothetical protein
MRGRAVDGHLYGVLRERLEDPRAPRSAPARLRTSSPEMAGQNQDQVACPSSVRPNGPADRPLSTLVPRRHTGHTPPLASAAPNALYLARTSLKPLSPPRAADVVPELPRLLEVSLVAKNVTPAFVRREILAGHLPARRLGGRRTQWRVKVLDALAYLEAPEHVSPGETRPTSAPTAPSAPRSGSGRRRAARTAPRGRSPRSGS